MKLGFLSVVAAVAAVAGCCCKTCCEKYADTVDEGFVPLFNGKDLTGWYGSKSYGVETVETKLNNGTVAKVNVLACQPDRREKGDRDN